MLYFPVILLPAVQHTNAQKGLLGIRTVGKGNAGKSTVRRQAMHPQSLASPIPASRDFFKEI